MVSQFSLSIHQLNGQGAYPSPPSQAQTWQASKNAAAAPKEDEGRVDADNRSVAQEQ